MRLAFAQIALTDFSPLLFAPGLARHWDWCTLPKNLLSQLLNAAEGYTTLVQETDSGEKVILLDIIRHCIGLMLIAMGMLSVSQSLNAEEIAQHFAT
jgi:hypothetical protein